jgi:hypothetical protein
MHVYLPISVLASGLLRNVEARKHASRVVIVVLLVLAHVYLPVSSPRTVYYEETYMLGSANEISAYP